MPRKRVSGIRRDAPYLGTAKNHRGQSPVTTPMHLDARQRRPLTNPLQKPISYQGALSWAACHAGFCIHNLCFLLF